MAIVASTLTLALPKFIGDKIILKKMKAYLVQVVDMQSGRIGSDFEERIDKSKLDFRWEMLRKIDSAIEGISAAIEKGMAQRTTSGQEITARKNALFVTMRKLEIIADRLNHIRQQAGGEKA